MCSHSKSLKWDSILANGSLSSFHFTVFTAKNKSASVVPFTLSILYFRLLMHFLQGDQSESSIKGATSQIKVKTWLATFQMKRMSWRRPRMVRRLLRTKKPKNPKPEPRFPFRNFHFGLSSTAAIFRRTLKKTLKTQELSQKMKRCRAWAWTTAGG